MPLPTPLRRLVYRCSYRVLQVYWFVARPAMQGVKCALTDGDRVLLVRHTYGHREWDIPGGGLRRNEPPAGGARREMREELGIVAEWTPIGTMPTEVHHRQDTLHCFQAEISAPALRLDHGELATAAWFARDALPEDRAPWVASIVALTLRSAPTG